MNKNDKVSLFLQVCRFGIVGLTSSIIHYTIVVELVQANLLQPLIANVFAFFISFQFSYWGHRLWTFNDSLSLHRDALPRLLLVQCINLSVNETLFATFMSWGLPYNIALIFVLTILPIFTFVSSKWWVFR